MPGLIVTIISVSLPLIIQYLITIRPLREQNIKMSDKLQDKSFILIEEFIVINKEEKQELKKVKESTSSNNFTFDSEENYFNFQSYVQARDSEIDNLCKKLKHNQKEYWNLFLNNQTSRILQFGVFERSLLNREVICEVIIK